MYLIEDEGLNKLLGGEFFQVILARKNKPKINVTELYNFQFTYFSYQGFRKFYRKHLEPIIDHIRIIEDKSLIGRVIRWLSHEKNK